MNPVRTTSLNEEIQQMLAELNMPQKIRAILQHGIEELHKSEVSDGDYPWGKKLLTFSLQIRETTKSSFPKRWPRGLSC
jgi:hypothetical protein